MIKNLLSQKKNFIAVTLVELLIVVGIVSVISLAIIPSFMDFSRKKEFENKTNTIIYEITNVRNKALAGAVVEGEPENIYWVFQPAGGCNKIYAKFALGYQLTPSATFREQYTQSLPDDIEFDTSTGNCSTLIFERLTGRPVMPDAATTSLKLVLQDKTDASLRREITINSSGLISYD